MRLLLRHVRPSRPSGGSRSRLAPAAVGVLLLASLAGCGDDGDGEAASGGATSCSYETDGRGAAREVEKPPESPEYQGDVAATIALGQGDLTLTLDADRAPCTVNSFASLASQDYFTDTPCHRLTTEGIYVLQCGDPTGQGTGGPGYSFDDRLTGDEQYTAGTLAMANAGPDTNGSQFFIVYEDTPLPPQYTVFGELDGGSLDLVDDIAAEGTESGAPDGTPAAGVTIEDVTVGD